MNSAWNNKKLINLPVDDFLLLLRGGSSSAFSSFSIACSDSWHHSRQACTLFISLRADLKLTCSICAMHTDDDDVYSVILMLQQGYHSDTNFSCSLINDIINFRIWSLLSHSITDSALILGRIFAPSWLYSRMKLEISLRSLANVSGVLPSCSEMNHDNSH